jgi:hypothetical protein
MKMRPIGKAYDLSLEGFGIKPSWNKNWVKTSGYFVGISKNQIKKTKCQS